MLRYYSSKCVQNPVLEERFDVILTIHLVTTSDICMKNTADTRYGKAYIKRLLLYKNTKFDIFLQQKRTKWSTTCQLHPHGQVLRGRNLLAAQPAPTTQCGPVQLSSVIQCSATTQFLITKFNKIGVCTYILSKSHQIFRDPYKKLRNHYHWYIIHKTTLVLNFT